MSRVAELRKMWEQGGKEENTVVNKRNNIVQPMTYNSKIEQNYNKSEINCTNIVKEVKNVEQQKIRIDSNKQTRKEEHQKLTILTSNIQKQAEIKPASQEQEQRLSVKERRKIFQQKLEAQKQSTPNYRLSNIQKLSGQNNQIPHRNTINFTSFAQKKQETPISFLMQSNQKQTFEPKKQQKKQATFSQPHNQNIPRKQIIKSTDNDDKTQQSQQTKPLSFKKLRQKLQKQCQQGAIRLVATPSVNKQYSPPVVKQTHPIQVSVQVQAQVATDSPPLSFKERKAILQNALSKEKQKPRAVQPPIASEARFILPQPQPIVHAQETNKVSKTIDQFDDQD